ncbi:hypothetical protein [Edaphobacter sp.]|uniref:hypothetical protein n=1 Tax=Edaphobacter sp. TaxID=1934404 RepID=UPI0039C8AA7C
MEDSVYLKLTETARSTIDGKEAITVAVRLYDANGNLCLNANNLVHFTVVAPGALIDNRGTSRGSRVVQTYNGRSEISVHSNNGGSLVGPGVAGIRTAFYTLS